MEELVLKFGVAYVVFAILLLFLFRRYLYSVFDPAIFVILIMASSLCLSLDSTFFYYILLACLAFYLGVATNGRIKRDFSVPIQKNNIILLEIFTLGVFCLYMIANMILYKDAEIPLFSDNVTENKVAIFGAGSGWIRRILFFSSFLPIGLLLTIIISTSRGKRIFYGFLLFIYMMFSVFLGSKTGFLGMFFVLWLLYTQENLWTENNKKIKDFIKGKIKYFLAGSILIFVFIIINENQEGPGKLIFNFGFKLMEFGDAVIYYKEPSVRKYFESYNIIDFFSVELNGILGILRIVDYKEPLGFIMYKVNYGIAGEDVITGPNGIFLIRGHIFFGYVGGIVYCYLVGYLFSYFRKKILMMRITNVFFYAIILFIFFNLDGFLREFNQYLSVFFDFTFYTFIIFFIALLFNDYVVKNRKLKQSVER
jgi:hypothetical protein